jgi:diadenosine tetraphosphate (Ap4A) HIT family hydrolase
LTNSTTAKFGFPGSLVAEFDHWLVLARPAQITLGSLVLAAKSDATAYGALPPAAFAEQQQAVGAIERALTSFVQYERINYLMLMMVDPHVHFHVVPRYSGTREWEELKLPDLGWPGPPDLKSALALSTEQVTALARAIAVHF